MAGALAAAIRKQHPDVAIGAADIDSQRLEVFASGVSGAEVSADNRSLAGEETDVLFLAVKPQVIPQVLRQITETSTLVISIAAGVPLSALETGLPAARVVRVMPNTPCLVGRMAGGYTCGARVTAEDRELVASLLSAAGTVFELEEPLLDAVTGLSGSGPAFVARLIEAFADAGAEEGLPREVADALAFATFAGTAALLEEKRMAPATLVEMVSSPGGTTLAGRAILEASQLRAIISETVAAAATRSRALGSQAKGLLS